MTKEEQKNILEYLEQLSDKPLGYVWNEYDWKAANSMRVWFLRDCVNDVLDSIDTDDL